MSNIFFNVSLRISLYNSQSAVRTCQALNTRHLKIDSDIDYSFSMPRNIPTLPKKKTVDYGHILRFSAHHFVMYRWNDFHGLFRSAVKAEQKKKWGKEKFIKSVNEKRSTIGKIWIGVII